MYSYSPCAHLSPRDADRRLLSQCEHHLIDSREACDVLYQLNRVACEQMQPTSWAGMHLHARDALAAGCIFGERNEPS